MPLKRHPALASLSREHHAALVLARAVQLGGSAFRAKLPGDPRGLAAHTVRVYADELAPHFAAEEELVLVAARGHGAELEAVCDDIENDHAQLRAMIDELGSGALDESQIGSLLDRFGKLLEAHVRKEERFLYAGVQTALDEDALNALGAALAARGSVSASSCRGGS
jgi:hypothetical protein